jgi:hypothetical protein
MNDSAGVGAVAPLGDEVGLAGLVVDPEDVTAIGGAALGTVAQPVSAEMIISAQPTCSHLPTTPRCTHNTSIPVNHRPSLLAAGAVRTLGLSHLGGRQ